MRTVGLKVLLLPVFALLKNHVTQYLIKIMNAPSIFSHRFILLYWKNRNISDIQMEINLNYSRLFCILFENYLMQVLCLRVLFNVSGLQSQNAMVTTKVT